MPEYTDTTIIRRTAFGSEASSPLESLLAPSPEPVTPFRGHDIEYEFVDVGQTAAPPTKVTDPSAIPQTAEANSDDGQSFEFRLFAPSKNADSSYTTTSKPRTKVKLPPTQDVSEIPISEGCFVKSSRPKTYYFTSALPTSLLKDIRDQYETSAISPAAVFRNAISQPWPGTALPWRVINIVGSKTGSNPNSFSPKSNASTACKAEGTRRSKPNKRRRIQHRKLLLARTAAANAKARGIETAEEKEKALREKKAAKNRKVQLKRRAKERQKKAQAKTAESGVEGE